MVQWQIPDHVCGPLSLSGDQHISESCSILYVYLCFQSDGVILKSVVTLYNVNVSHYRCCVQYLNLLFYLVLISFIVPSAWKGK